MNYEYFSPSLKKLWRITAGVAIFLLIITLMLFVKSRSNPSHGFSGYISGQNTIVYLRKGPDKTSQTIAILNPGTVVFVDNSTTRDDITWYHLETESGNGWIPEANLSLTSP